MKRRDFLKKMAVCGAAASVACGASNALAQEKKGAIHWKMVTTWPPRLPYLQTGMDLYAKIVDMLSGGRLKIEVFAGGELIPALGCFDAVSSGTYQCFSGAGHYWAGKIPAAQWFSAVPFGMNAEAQNAWYTAGDGMKLWEEAYKPFNLIPRFCGQTGVQMGGWFNKKIESIDDYKGLKMRIPGLGGKVVAKAGGTVILTPGGEIFTNLERGVIDACEWLAPQHDMLMGFYKAAKYYYYPGWQEPGTALEVTFNKNAYESLPKDLQAILDYSCQAVTAWEWAGLSNSNAEALEELITKYHVNVIPFPENVLNTLRKLSQETLEEIAASNPLAKKVNENYKAFMKKLGPWSTISERAYYNVIAEKYPIKA